jgi:hypothetical protein
LKPTGNGATQDEALGNLQSSLQGSATVQSTREPETKASEPGANTVKTNGFDIMGDIPKMGIMVVIYIYGL